ncbi:MAG: IS630 family transposase, partial [Cyanobacteria bacterium]|nr:IS630 family transposase [Cyanobacteriota bacterium]
VKKQCLYSVYYPDFSSFKLAISNCLEMSHTTHKQELDSLLTLRFQSLKTLSLFPVKVYL